MNYKKLIKSIFSQFDKGEKVIDMVGTLKECNIKSIDIRYLLEELDMKQININENIKVKGFLTKYAPLYEPTTYIDRCYKMSKESENYFSVIPCSPPVILNKSLDEENTIAYLYIENVSRPFEFDSDDMETLIVEERNKYIPIFIKISDLDIYSEKNVILECSIVKLYHNELEEYCKFRNKEYEEIISLFYDEYNEHIDFIALKCEDILKEDIHKNIDLKATFLIELELYSEKISDEFIDKEIIKSIEKINPNNSKIKAFYHEDSLVKSYLAKKDVSINVNGKYVGFYVITSLNNRNEYRNSMRELKNIISSFSKNINNNIDINISFISDYRKENKLF